MLVPYPEEGKDAKDQRRPSALLEEANEKCAGLLGEKFRGLSRGLLPRCPGRGRGECGRGSVGEVVVRIRLFLLLVRQLLVRRNMLLVGYLGVALSNSSSNNS